MRSLKIENAYLLLNTLVASFSAAGGLGFINFIILEKLDIIRNDKEKHDDKKFFVLFFSIINYVVFLLIFSFPKEQLLIREFVTKLSMGILLTLFVSVVFSFTIYPVIAKLLLMLINLFRKKILSRGAVDNQTPRESLFSRGDVSTFVYIFDFEKNRVAEGYLEGWIDDLEKQNQVVVTAPGTLTKYTYEQVEALFNDLDNDPEPETTKHLIDIDNKLHYFVFYQSNLS